MMNFLHFTTYTIHSKLQDPDDETRIRILKKKNGSGSATLLKRHTGMLIVLILQVSPRGVTAGCCRVVCSHGGCHRRRGSCTRCHSSRPPPYAGGPLRRRMRRGGSGTTTDNRPSSSSSRNILRIGRYLYRYLSTAALHRGCHHRRGSCTQHHSCRPPLYAGGPLRRRMWRGESATDNRPSSSSSSRNIRRICRYTGTSQRRRQVQFINNHSALGTSI